MRKRRITNYPKAVMIGVALSVLFVLITPRCQSPSKVNPNKSYGVRRDPGVAFVIDSMRACGFAVESHYPVYVRFVKRQISGDPIIEVQNIARTLKNHTGISIKAQLDLSDGSYLADPDRGIIDPTEIIVHE